MKIKTKLLSSFSILILLSIVLGLASYKTIDNLSSKINPAIELNNEVNLHMLHLRRNEKDFLARSLIEEDFFTKGESIYLNKFDSEYSTLLNKIDNLDHFSSDQQYHEKMAEMKSLVSDYHTQFKEVVNKKSERGFKDWGTIGSLRESVHNIEKKLQEFGNAENKYQLLSTMLMCRRHEKDYLLRNDPKYQQILAGRVDEFIGLVQTSGLAALEQAELKRLILDYLNKFNNLVLIDEEIGRTASDGLMGSYRETIHKLEPLVNEQDRKLKAEINSLVKESTITLLFIIALITVFGFGLALILSSKITRPLINMTKAGKRISTGDLSAQIPDIKTNDEVKEMGETMDLLIGAIKFHLSKK